MTPRILIIAGSDSGGGAGIQADIKTVTMLGGHAMTAITAITAQNTLGVQGVHPIPTAMVIDQIESVVQDIGVDAIKIGMIGSAETAHALADYLSSSFPRRRESVSRPINELEQEMDSRLRWNDLGSEVPIVFDPVMVATSGSMLADAETVAAFDRLANLSSLTTPNAPELQALSGTSFDEEIGISNAAGIFMTRTGCPAVLAKGGHMILSGQTYGRDADGHTFSYPNVERVFDFLYQCNSTGWHETQWDAERIDTHHTHGTGCTLASAIATGMGQGMNMTDSIIRARRYVRAALRCAPGFGGGQGPMGVPQGFVSA